MRKLFVASFALAFALPSLALAAYNDLTLTTSTVISVGGYTLDVSGSSATVQSITVNATNLTVTLASGSSITISSPTLQQLSSDVTNDVTNNTCTGSASSITLAYSGSGTVTNTITPSSTICSGSGSAPASSGGGNGAPAGLITTAFNPANNAVLPVASTTASTTTATAPGSTAPAASNSLQQAPTPVFTFTENLSRGITGPEVKALQQYLNAQGFTLASTGAGSPGNETDYFGLLTFNALVKFQDAHAAQILAPLGLAQGTGYFGASTKAFVNGD